MLNYLNSLVIGAALALGGCVSDKPNIQVESAQPIVEPPKNEQPEDQTIDNITDELLDGETDILKDGTQIGIREILPRYRPGIDDPASMVIYHTVEDGTIYQIGNPFMTFDALMDIRRTLSIEIMLIEQGLSSFETRKAYLESVDTNNDFIIDFEESFKVYKDNRSKNPDWDRIYESLLHAIVPIDPDTSIVKPN